MNTTITILQSKIKNNRTIILFRNDFNNMHIAIWDGTDIDSYQENSLPRNFRMTASYGKNENDPYLLAKFNDLVSKAGTDENWKIIK